MNDPLSSFTVGRASVRIYATGDAMAEATATCAAEVLSEAVRARGQARVIIGTGPSQAAFIAALTRRDVPWSRVEVFHMDEYLGMPATHPASFRRWLHTHLTDIVRPAAVHDLAGDAPDVDAEMARYASLLHAGPIDLSCVGFGENGHLAFNDPHVADFDDPLTVKRVDLDERCRLQQVGEGHFSSLEASPATALTVTLPGLMRAGTVIACVPDRRKAEAVRAALTGPIDPMCPASLVRRHPRAFVFLDTDAASLLDERALASVTSQEG
jgi:glucosamine-6-phosphate deaminase